MAITTFFILWVNAQQLSIEFNTDIDSIYTAHEQRNALHRNPRYGWILGVHFTQYPALQAFFIARKGRWNAFNFTWSADKGGDGLTYLVRFDTDKLTLTGGSAIVSVPIVQVVTGE